MLHHSRSPDLPPRELTQPRPRQPARSRAAAAHGALHPVAPPTCCPGCSAATRGRAPTSRRSATSSTSPRARRRGSRRRSAACRPTARCCRTGSAPLFVRLLEPLVDPALAARIPFALLLALALALTWYAAYHLARSESAQPLPFAFGGEAEPVDYARAIADGALLALIASLGLLQLGHETTPELVQLAAVALYLYGLGAAPHHALQGRAGRGAGDRRPRGERRAEHRHAARRRRCVALRSIAAREHGVARRRLARARRARSAPPPRPRSARGRTGSAPTRARRRRSACVRQIAWFAWPAWLLALWTLWQWRRRLASRHIVVPLAVATTLLGVWLAMAGSDRALMLALPRARRARGVRVADAASAAPPRRSTGSRCSSSRIAVATGWVFYVAMQTGTPAKLAANVAKLSPGYANTFSAFALALALAGTLAWLWLVRWRTGRHRHPLWKSLVLPAGGVSICWLLVDDAAPAAARQRAQLSLDDPAHRAAGAGRRLHRRARHGARAGRRARVPRRLSRRCRRDARPTRAASS